MQYSVSTLHTVQWGMVDNLGSLTVWSHQHNLKEERPMNEAQEEEVTVEQHKQQQGSSRGSQH